MTGAQFQATLHRLGLSHSEAAALLYDEPHKPAELMGRSIRRLAKRDSVPPAIAKLLAVMVAKRLTPASVDRALQRLPLVEQAAEQVV